MQLRGDEPSWTLRCGVGFRSRRGDIERALWWLPGHRREPMRLQGKSALISGGARGMGAVEARLFAKEGAKVTIGDVLDDEGRKLEAEINAIGGEALFVRLDVTREADWQQ